MYTFKVDANTFPAVQNQKNCQKSKFQMTTQVLGGVPKCDKEKSANVDNPNNRMSTDNTLHKYQEYQNMQANSPIAY